MKLLITGGCGFVGSSLALQFKANYPAAEVIAFDNLKRRGSELNVNRLKLNGIKFIHGDIRNKEDFDAIGEITCLIEASAEPSVLAGVNSSPDYLINTNLAGTINCLNYARKFNATFVFLSTSRVYPIKTIERLNYAETATRFILESKQTVPGTSERGFSEDFPLAGTRSLYGATKLASELIIQEYNELYNIKAVIIRCGVISGPWQMGKVDQGVVVLWAANHYWKGKLSYIGYGGEGKQVRDVLHVADLYDLVDLQLKDIDKVNGEIFNVGGGMDCSASLMELTALCEERSGNKLNIEKISQNRPYDLRLYLTDNSKVERITGWKPKRNLKTIVQEIFDWIEQNNKELIHILQ
ncbi:MAG: NAD-dependent epimerase/dehydratase family protein [Chitinophagales bacterium]|nr:NAD-dependent epimerase/dehydratase family protein [Chitinophagales bacterium]